MKGVFLLYVVIGKSAAVSQLRFGKDEMLLVHRDFFLFLDRGLHVVDGVRRLQLQGNRLPR